MATPMSNFVGVAFLENFAEGVNSVSKVLELLFLDIEVVILPFHVPPPYKDVHVCNLALPI